MGKCAAEKGVRPPLASTSTTLILADVWPRFSPHTALVPEGKSPFGRSTATSAALQSVKEQQTRCRDPLQRPGNGSSVVAYFDTRFMPRADCGGTDLIRPSHYSSRRGDDDDDGGSAPVAPSAPTPSAAAPQHRIPISAKFIEATWATLWAESRHCLEAHGRCVSVIA